MSRADREPIKTEKPHYHSAKPSLPLSRRLNHYGAAVSLDTAFNNTERYQKGHDREDEGQSIYYYQ
jgi:hypothetical protein